MLSPQTTTVTQKHYNIHQFDVEKPSLRTPSNSLLKSAKSTKKVFNPTHLPTFQR